MIMSVDTGINNFGVSIFRPGTKNILHIETIVTAKSKEKKIRVSLDYARRISYIANQLNNLILKYKVTGITGELPSFGSKSASAAVSLSSGSALILTLCVAHNIVPIWESPREIKLLFTGNPNAEKKEIMEKCCKIYGWEITRKKVKDKRQPEGFRLDPTYHVMGLPLSAGYFEHIADSVAAYHTCVR